MFNVDKKVAFDIKIDEEGVINLIKEAVTKQDPTIEVTEVKFMRRKNPGRLEVEVVAQLKEQPESPMFPALKR